MTLMEEGLQDMKTSIEYDLNERQPQLKADSTEDGLNGRQKIKWKTTSMED